ncbi:hypothetical protein GCM10009555_019700 [Acrocarpospora macrocephala]|uniref:Intradiol ring-cleavage dioxygenases domain-containing protein n=2 Tax=Acrocarpospora macrocephala TaxID=150177 RepID=A0A5M3WI70_9ACTN|nr:hypothetical protein Amac_016250 [Acrocarpospora macrocephala]
MLGLFGGAMLVGAVGCSEPEQNTSTQATGQPANGQSSSSQEEIPDETAGPYPGDGSNGPNALTQSGVVRQDIRSSFGSASGTAQGVPLVVELNIINAGAPYAGAAVYLWHCDREGRYSLYSEGITEENYLRGVQEATPAGLIRFTTIFPGAYTGRWPHIHFEVYGNLTEATTASEPAKTTQLAFPQESCTEVYTNPGYEQSATNLAASSLETDNVFSDGYTTQLATITGDPTNGYTARLDVHV